MDRAHVTLLYDLNAQLMESLSVFKLLASELRHETAKQIFANLSRKRLSMIEDIEALVSQSDETIHVREIPTKLQQHYPGMAKALKEKKQEELLLILERSENGLRQTYQTLIAQEVFSHKTQSLLEHHLSALPSQKRLLLKTRQEAIFSSAQKEKTSATEDVDLACELSMNASDPPAFTQPGASTPKNNH